jgi:hypothetical protein
MSKEEANKPEPIFHFGDNFSSAYFGEVPPEISGAQNPGTDAKLISNFIDLLTNPDKKDLRTDALETIRNAKAQQFLVDLIAMPDQEKNQRDLVMACWETGLDFSAHLIFFTKLVVNCGYPVALEAMTVIEEMHVLKDIQLIKNALEILNSDLLNSENKQLAEITAAHLEQKLDNDSL